jgi:hypothetical protein
MAYSVLLKNEELDFIHIAGKYKSTGATYNLYISKDYYPYNAIYSTSPEAFPLLASSVRIVRSVGINSAKRNDISFDLYAHNPLDDFTKSLYDLTQEVEFQGATVTVYYYIKASGNNNATNDSNSIRGVYELIDFTLTDGGLFKCTARDSWFKDKDLGKKFNLPTMQTEWANEYGALVFGDDDNQTLIDAVVYGEYTPNDTGSDAILFCGWLPSDLYFPQFDSSTRLLIKNENTSVYKDQFFKVDIDYAQMAIYGAEQWQASQTATVWYSALTNQRANLDSPRNWNSPAGVVLAKASTSIKTSGTYSADEGQLLLEVYHAEYDTSGRPRPIGSAISTGIFEITSTQWANGATVAQTVWAHLHPMPTLHPDGDYLFIVKWSNEKSTTVYPLLGVWNATGATHYANNVGGSKDSWVAQTNVGFSLFLYPLGFNSVHPISSSGDLTEDCIVQNISTYITLGTYCNEEAPLRDLTFKINSSGVTDDGSGTYTGTINAYLSNPVDIIRYILMSTYEPFGLGLGASKVDTSLLDTTRGLVTTRLGFAIKEPISAEALILKICEQSGLIFYKTRAGKLAIKKPIFSGVPDLVITEGRWWNDIKIINNNSAEHSNIINAYKLNFGEDNSSSPNDNIYLRSTKDKKKFTTEIILNKDTSTLGDLARQAFATTSESLYDRKEAQFNFDFLKQQSHAVNVANYYFDKYKTARKKVTFSVPRFLFYSQIDIFTTISLSHTDLANANGTSACFKVMDTGTKLITYDEGIPCDVVEEGTVIGEVTEVVEELDRMIITIEEQLGF